MAERLGETCGVDLGDAALYRHWMEEPIRFADMDPLNHMGHVTYGYYYQNARLDYWASLGLDPVDAKLGLVVVKLAMDYRAPLAWPGRVRTGTRAIAVGRSSVTTGSGMFAPDGTCLGTAEVVTVRFDDATGRTQPWEAAVRDRLAAEVPGKA